MLLYYKTIPRVHIFPDFTFLFLLFDTSRKIRDDSK